MHINTKGVGSLREVLVAAVLKFVLQNSVNVTFCPVSLRRLDVIIQYQPISTIMSSKENLMLLNAKKCFKIVHETKPLYSY